jgi:hypothetical protein
MTTGGRGDDDGREGRRRQEGGETTTGGRGDDDRREGRRRREGG